MPDKRPTTSTLKLQPDDLAAIRRLLALHRDILERFARQGEVLDGIPVRLDALDATIQEWFDEAARIIETRLSKIEELLLLERSGHGGSARAEAVRAEIEREHDNAHLRRLLIQERKNLQKFREREARYGSLDAPISLINRIEETELRIEKLEGELEGERDN